LKTDWLADIDLYCERTAPIFWAEPFNAISNLSFIAAACWGYYTVVKLKMKNTLNIILCTLAASIGAGSFLFHTYANLWSSFADVIPIWTFVAVSIIAAITRITDKSLSRVTIITLGIFAIIVAVSWIISSGSATQMGTSNDVLNDSGQYAPALIALWVFAFKSKNSHIYKWILAAAIVFSLSLFARTVDLYLCHIFPIGTHFAWHLLNGLMVALLLQGIIRMQKHHELARGAVSDGN